MTRKTKRKKKWQINDQKRRYTRDDAARDDAMYAEMLALDDDKFLAREKEEFFESYQCAVQDCIDRGCP